MAAPPGNGGWGLAVVQSQRPQQLSSADVQRIFSEFLAEFPNWNLRDRQVFLASLMQGVAKSKSPEHIQALGDALRKCASSFSPKDAVAALHAFICDLKHRSYELGASRFQEKHITALALGVYCETLVHVLSVAPRPEVDALVNEINASLAILALPSHNPNEPMFHQSFQEMITAFIGAIATNVTKIADTKFVVGNTPAVVSLKEQLAELRSQYDKRATEMAHMVGASDIQRTAVADFHGVTKGLTELMCFIQTTCLTLNFAIGHDQSLADAVKVIEMTSAPKDQLVVIRQIVTRITELVQHFYFNAGVHPVSVEAHKAVTKQRDDAHQHIHATAAAQAVEDAATQAALATAAAEKAQLEHQLGAATFSHDAALRDKDHENAVLRQQLATTIVKLDASRARELAAVADAAEESRKQSDRIRECELNANARAVAERDGLMRRIGDLERQVENKRPSDGGAAASRVAPLAPVDPSNRVGKKPAVAAAAADRP